MTGCVLPSPAWSTGAITMPRSAEILSIPTTISGNAGSCIDEV